MTPFWIALQFLTTFPIHLKAMPTPQQNAQSLLFYPCIGLLIGGLLYIVALLLAPTPLLLQSALIVVIWIWLTGGLHYDGLADTADAWVGGFGDRERTLNIMKDPSCGPIGVLAIVMVVLLKFAGIYVVLEQKATLILLLLPALARTAPLILLRTSSYVRQQGIAKDMTQYLPKGSLWVVVVFSLAMGLCFKLLGCVLILSFIAVLAYLRMKFVQRLGGVTGDTIGASIEILETLTLLMAAIYVSTFA